MSEQIEILCPKCNSVYKKEKNIGYLKVCIKCDYHFRLDARERINSIVDTGSFREFHFEFIKPYQTDFPGYNEKLKAYQETTKESEAFVCGECTIGGFRVSIGVLFSQFMMGSMGFLVGEKIKSLIDYSKANQSPLIIFSASGGARMQEGILALMQMAKISSALKTFSTEKNLYISVMTDPTTGGVAASFAYQGDYVLAEKGALIGFSGKRVTMQTIKVDIPENFQTAEYHMENGFLDLIVHRAQLKTKLIELLRIHK